MTDEEKEKDEWSWDDEDPVADKADFLYSYKLAADVLQKKNGYSYEYVKFVAELDHHDVPTFKTILSGCMTDSFGGAQWQSICNIK